MTAFYTLRPGVTEADMNNGLDALVYWNLHRKVWSVMAKSGRHKGKVVAYASHVLLADATGQVSEAGRLRVLATGKKNVHAGIRGKVSGLGAEAPKLVQLSLKYRETWRGITYNPKKYTSFVYRNSEAPFTRTAQVYLADDRLAYTPV